MNDNSWSAERLLDSQGQEGEIKKKENRTGIKILRVRAKEKGKGYEVCDASPKNNLLV